MTARIRTHYEGCWESHLECAALRCKELEKQVRELNELIVRMVEAQARALISHPMTECSSTTKGNP